MSFTFVSETEIQSKGKGCVAFYRPSFHLGQENTSNIIGRLTADTLMSFIYDWAQAGAEIN